MCLNPFSPQTQRLFSTDGVFHSLYANSGGGQDRAGIIQENNLKKIMNEPLDKDIAEMEYIVRRLMPVECERLMGLPDDYTKVHFTEEILTDELVDEFVEIKRNWDAMNAEGKPVKPKSRKAMRSWLLGISTNPPDSPRYKACGNGWATNQPRWIVMNILNTFHPGWDDVSLLNDTFGISTTSTATVHPFQDNHGINLRASPGGCGGVLKNNKHPSVGVFEMTHGDDPGREVTSGAAPTLLTRMGSGGNQVPLVELQPQA